MEFQNAERARELIQAALDNGIPGAASFFDPNSADNPHHPHHQDHPLFGRCFPVGIIEETDKGFKVTFPEEGLVSLFDAVRSVEEGNDWELQTNTLDGLEGNTAIDLRKAWTMPQLAEKDPTREGTVVSISSIATVLDGGNPKSVYLHQRGGNPDLTHTGVLCHTGTKLGRLPFGDIENSVWQTVIQPTMANLKLKDANITEADVQKAINGRHEIDFGSLNVTPKQVEIIAEGYGAQTLKNVLVTGDITEDDTMKMRNFDLCLPAAWEPSQMENLQAVKYSGQGDIAPQALHLIAQLGLHVA